MKKRNTEEYSMTEKLAWQVLKTTPLMQRKLLKPEIEQADNAIPLSHIHVLSMLDQLGSMTVSDISIRFGIAKPNITPLIDRLADAGYVRRVRDDEDRRVVNVEILEKGREKLRLIHGSICTSMDAWLSELPEDTIKQFSDALGVIHDVLEKV